MATHGNKRKFYLTISGKETWLKGEQSNNLNLDAEMLEATDKSSDWKQFVPGMKGGTADVTVFADTEDAAQSELINSLFNGTKVTCVIGEDAGDGMSFLDGYMFDAYVSSISTPAENGSLVTRSISLQITGTVMKYQ